MRKPAAEVSVYTSHPIFKWPLGQQEILLSFRCAITDHCCAHWPSLEETVFEYMGVGKVGHDHSG